MSYYRNNRSYRGRGGRYVDQHTRDQQYHYYPNQAVPIHHGQHIINNNNNDNNIHNYFNQKRPRYSNPNWQYRQKQRSNYHQFQQFQQYHQYPQYQLKPIKQEHKEEKDEEIDDNDYDDIECKTKTERSWIEYDEEDEDRKSEHSNDIHDNYSNNPTSEYQYEYEYGNGDEYEHEHEHVAIEYNNYYSREKTQNIRDMNNWCKYVNITHSIRDIYNKNNDSKINILDLGCGAGNDLFKCRGNKKYINKYLAMDIDPDYITTARKKYFKILQDGIKHRNASYEERKKFSLNNAYGQTAKEFYDESIFDAQFIINDMCSNTLYKHPLIKNYKPFQLVNIQFALHFGFQTNKSILALLKTIESATEKGSYLLCSFMRDNIIYQRLGQLINNGATFNDKYVSFRNQFQSITMKKTDFKLIQNIYDQYDLFTEDIENIYKQKNNDIDIHHDLIGIKYKYYQMDSVEGIDGDGDYEWFISFITLCKLLWKHCRMRLIYKKTASDIYIESSRQFPYKYGYSKGRELNNVKWTKDEQQVIDTYSYVMFKRV